MLDINKLKQRFLEYGKQLENRLLESNSFNILKERYQSLNALTQNFLKYGLLSVFSICILSVPVYYLSVSLSSWLQFKNKYELSLDLEQLRKKKSRAFKNSSIQFIHNSITQLIQKYSLDDFDISKESQPFSLSPLIQHVFFNVSVKNLNIKQAIQLGADFQNLSQIRLDELVFRENEDYKKHYDIYYKLSFFTVQEALSKNIQRPRRFEDQKASIDSKEKPKGLFIDKKEIKKKGLK